MCDVYTILIFKLKSLIALMLIHWLLLLRVILLLHTHITKFRISVAPKQDNVPTMYWLPKMHKTPYKARFIANSSSCTTTKLSVLLTSCLTAVKEHVIRYCEKVFETSGKNLFWSIKNSSGVLKKLKSNTFQAFCLSTYDFSTLYTSLPHNLRQANQSHWKNVC